MGADGAQRSGRAVPRHAPQRVRRHEGPPLRGGHSVHAIPRPSAAPRGEAPVTDHAAFHAFVRGRVQMVGFRWFALHAAEQWGVEGWVRNCPDGSVEVEASGPRERLERFIEDLRRGPSSARVSGVDVEWLSRLPNHRDFQITH
ncbi:acylphosphatase [Candidatus Sumerlaeota bacterium]|nr:acylphosphatase [Candidatus Sumerlaeota bacterium]